jgi:gamma-glutamylputrescine oxidase
MSVSHWRRHKAPETIEADICIIGAGICGLSCALEAEAHSLRAIIIERSEIAAGASGRSAGFLMRGMAESYAAAADALGRDRARKAWQWSEENLSLLKADGAVSLPSFRNAPSCLLALTEADAADLERSAAMLREDGFAVEHPWQCDDTVFASGRVRAALLNPHDAAVNPVDLCRLLASKLRAPVIEGQEAHAIDAGDTAVIVRCPDVEVRAQQVIVCVNAWAGALLPQLAALVKPNRGQVLAARASHPRAVRLDASYYANRGADYLRQTPDGAIVVGGQRARFAAAERTDGDTTTPQVQHAIEAFARDLLGPDLEIVARWAGIMGFSPDGLPLIGPVAGGADGPGRIWFCGGFTGHGMSLARRAAREAVAAMLEGRQPEFPIDRFTGAGAKGPDPVC